MKKITLFACAMLMAMGVQAAVELYAVQDGTRLIIYYDGKRVSRNGKVAPTGEHTGWWDYTQGTAIYTIQFDPSVANATPTSTAYWFDGFKGVTSINDINYLNTNSVTTMERMFRYCESLTSLQLYTAYWCFNTGMVTNMHGMFQGCKALTTLDLNRFDTREVTSMKSMFLDCEGLTSIKFGSVFDTDKVTNMMQMFDGCTSLTKLNLSGFEVGNVKIFTKMFYGANNLTTIYADYNWADFAPSTTTSTDMFTGCSKLKGANGTKYSASSVDITYARPDVAGTKGYFTKSSCPMPRDLQATNITASSVKISWTDEAKHMKSTVYCTRENSPGIDVSADVTTNSATLTGLTPNTTYIVYVESQCSASASSERSRQITFTTGAPGQGVEEVQGDKVQSTKILRDGQLLILVGDQTYDARGIEIKK